MRGCVGTVALLYRLSMTLLMDDAVQCGMRCVRLVGSLSRHRRIIIILYYYISHPSHGWLIYRSSLML